MGIRFCLAVARLNLAKKTSELKTMVGKNQRVRKNPLNPRGSATDKTEEKEKQADQSLVDRPVLRVEPNRSTAFFV